jgi:AhpD family alkylhydroperoxidase
MDDSRTFQKVNQMGRRSFEVPRLKQLGADSQILLENLKKQLNGIPNLYATIGYSSHALRGFLEFEDELKQGVFSRKEREAIALVVSEVNGCAYCLAGHTVAAIKSGFSQEETIMLRKGESGNRALYATLQLAKSIVENKGEPDESLLIRFFMAGYMEDAVIELVGLVSATVFTNYVYGMTNIPIDFPDVQPLTSSLSADSGPIAADPYSCA